MNKHIDPWKTERIVINDTVYEAEVKTCYMPSEFGIRKGKILKMCIKKNGRIKFNYDRIYDVRLDKSDKELVWVYKYLYQKYNK